MTTSSYFGTVCPDCGYEITGEWLDGLDNDSYDNGCQWFDCPGCGVELFMYYELVAQRYGKAEKH